MKRSVAAVNSPDGARTISSGTSIVLLLPSCFSVSSASSASATTVTATS